jgi:hypothetical protein
MHWFKKSRSDQFGPTATGDAGRVELGTGNEPSLKAGVREHFGRNG